MDFVDDTLEAARGTAEEQSTTLALIIMFWKSLGLQLAWKKTQRVCTVRWIHLQFGT